MYSGDTRYKIVSSRYVLKILLGRYFLGNVNLHSCSLYAIAVLSVCRLYVCNVGDPTQPVEIFGNFSCR